LADLQGEWNTSEHRIMNPARRLSERGHRSFITHIGEVLSDQITLPTRAELDQADVIIIERLCIGKAHALIEKYRGLGKQVWITFDDNYALIPGTPARDIWRGKKSGSILNDFRDGLRLATGFMTPSKLLCEDFRMYNDRAEYVPNYLNLDWWSNTPAPSPDVKTIGYGGTSLHNISLRDSGVIPALGKLCRESNKLKVHLQPPFPDVVQEFNRLGVRYSFGAWQAPEDWPKTVSQFTVGIAPLSGNYDMRRSNLKALEYATLGIPWVASQGDPYQEALGGILVKNRITNWYDALHEILTNARVYRDLSTSGLEWARTHNESCATRYMEVFHGR
jgi:glycosyltransferase involved in cell wall biosynthesis